MNSLYRSRSNLTDGVLFRLLLVTRQIFSITVAQHTLNPHFRLSGNFWLVSFKIRYLCLPLFYETRTTPSCHPSGWLIDNFDIVNFDKSADRFDIYLDEKKVQLKEDKTNPDIISYGFGEYRTIQDCPIRGRATYLHVRKRKWLDKSSNEIFSYDWDLSEFDGTRLNSEFVSFLKEGD